MAGLAPTLTKKEFNNWVKGALALLFTKDALTDFVSAEVDRHHQRLLQLVPAANLHNTCNCTINSLPPCTRSRNHSHIVPGPKQLCSRGVCNILMDGICKDHRFRGPSWKNTDPQKWCTNAFEVSKCCFPPDGYSHTTSLSETDFNGIVSVIINNLSFSTQIKDSLATEPNICTKARKVGREIRHTADHLLSDSDLRDYIDDLINLLCDPACLLNDPSAQEAVRKLRMLKTNDLTIHEKDITEALKYNIKDTFTEEHRDLLQKINDHYSKLQTDSVAEIDRIVAVRKTELEELAKKLTEDITRHAELKKHEIKQFDEMKENKEFEDKLKEYQMLKKIAEQFEAEPDLKRIIEDDKEFAPVYLDLKATGGRNSLELFSKGIDWLEKIKVCSEYMKQEGFLMEVKEMENELQQSQTMTCQRKKTEKDWEYCISESDLMGILKLLQKNSYPNPDQLNKICKLVGRKHPLTKIICTRFCEYIKNTFPMLAKSFIWPAYEIKDIKDTSDRINVCFVINDDRPQIFDFQNINVKIIRRNIKSPNKENEDVVEYELEKDVELDCKVLDEIETTINKNVMSLKEKHQNLIMISASPIKSSGYQTGNHHMKPTNCIVLFVPVKGLIPLEEDIFPRTVGNFETDVREGYCQWQTGKSAHDKHEQLKMGCAIGTLDIDKYGTLGGFLEHGKHGVCALTCAHVVLTENEMLNPKAFCNKICVQPKTNDKRDEFGSVENGMFILRSGTEDIGGLDAALIKIKTERLPVNGYFPDCKHDELETAGLGIDLKNLVYTSGNTFKIGSDNFEQCRKNPIVKYGAETSLRRGYLKSRRMSFMPNKVTYNNGPDIIYSNQIQIYHRRKYKPFADHGDSGALVFMVTDDGLVSIGLLMAVANGFSVVNPIHDVLEAFGCTSMSLIQFPAKDMTDSGFENGNFDN